MPKYNFLNVYLAFLGTFILFIMILFWNMLSVLEREKCKPYPEESVEELEKTSRFSHSNRQSNDNNRQYDLALIVPFRERFNQLLQFIPHMDKFLNRQNINHEFFIINQCDRYRFNRGQLINVGYLLMKNYSLNIDARYIAMHDVDLLPLNDQLSYGFPEWGPFHVSSPELHPKYHYKTYVGGILLIRNEHFELVNGFSNNYFGWGLEDDEFYARLKEANLNIYRPENIHPTNGKDGKNTSFFAHIHDDSMYKRDTAKLYNQREVTRKRDRQTGLNTTRFHLLQIHNLTIKDVPFRVFDVKLECDINKTPWCLGQRSSHKQRPSQPNQIIRDKKS